MSKITISLGGKDFDIPADAELFHNVFGSDAHVVMMISIGEAI